MKDESIVLADGRSLGYTQLGEPQGTPLFLFHGTPGSRLEISADDRIAQLPGVRLVLPDRPGYGISDPKPGRTLLDWAEDVAALADHLELHRFAVGGASGGGPHALACAFALPDRVTRIILLACPTPANFPGATRGMTLGNRLGLFLDRHAPWLARRLMQGMVDSLRKNPAGFVASLGKQMPAPDRELITDPTVRDALVRGMQEAYRQGIEGHASDAPITMTSRDWGFPLSEIRVPVFAWQGELDTAVTRAMADHLAREIPDCTLHIVAGKGHLLTECPEVTEGIHEALRMN